MAVQPLGASAPASPSASQTPATPAGARRQPLHLVQTSSTRTRRNHGTFMLGGQLAAVYSARGAGKCYGVSFELGAGTLTLADRMTASQARAMAQAMVAAAVATEAAAATEDGQGARRPGEAITSPRRARELLALRLAARQTVAFVAMYLDAGHDLIEVAELFSGSTTECAVYPREVARHALLANASAAIVAHNHPSGRPEPSPLDVALTRRLVSALGLVGVRLLDHVVIGGLSAVSMAERGLL